METKKVLELLQQLKRDPKAQELLKAAEKPSDEEGVAKLAAQVARQVGLPLEERDVLDALREVSAKQKAKTEAAANQVEKIPDAELDAVAGGNYKTSDGRTERCCYDFVDTSCVLMDACNAFVKNYYGCADTFHDYCSVFIEFPMDS